MEMLLGGAVGIGICGSLTVPCAAVILDLES